MKSLLRTALENADQKPEELEGPTITMNGPLSTVYSKALLIALAKDKEVTDVAVETASMDVTTAANQLQEIIGDQLEGYDYVDAYATTMLEITEEEVEEVKDAIDKRDPAVSQYVLIVDATNGYDDNNERFIGLESLVTSHGGLVYILK